MRNLKALLLIVMVAVTVACKKDDEGKKIDTKKEGIAAILGSYNVTNNYTTVILSREEPRYDTINSSKTYIITIDKPGSDLGLAENVVEIKNLLITRPTEKIYATLSPSGDVLDLLNISDDDDDHVFRSFQGVINDKNIVFDYLTYHFYSTGEEEGKATATKR